MMRMETMGMRKAAIRVDRVRGVEVLERRRGM